MLHSGLDPSTCTYTWYLDLVHIFIYLYMYLEFKMLLELVLRPKVLEKYQ